jgi:hypothetical protein
MPPTPEQQEIWNKFKIYYDAQHVKRVEFDDENKLLITGDVMAAMGSAGLNVRFGKLNGNFIANGMGFRSLRGSPEEVTGSFSVSRNRNLTSLEGAPLKVGEDFAAYGCKLTNLIGAPREIGISFMVFNNPLESLDGMPDHIGGTISLNYEPDLGLLRVLVAKTVDFSPGQSQVSWDKVIECQEILNKYAGQGRRGSFAAKKELIEAGFEGNARW